MSETHIQRDPRSLLGFSLIWDYRSSWCVDTRYFRIVPTSRTIYLHLGHLFFVFRLYLPWRKP